MSDIKNSPTPSSSSGGSDPIATVAEMGVAGMRLLLPHPPGSTDHLPIGTKLYAAPQDRLSGDLKARADTVMEWAEALPDGDAVDKATAWDQAIKSGQKARAKALEEAAKVAETGDYNGFFQTTGDERRAKAIAARIRALSAIVSEGE